MKEKIAFFKILIPLLLGSFGLGCSTESPSKPKPLSSSERARLLIEIANGALLEGDPTGALQNLARAEELDSHLPELHHSKALAYYAKHNVQAALEEAQKAVSLKPDYSDANNTLGKILVDFGKYEEAYQKLERAAHDPLYRDAYKSWTNLGILKYRQGELSNAEGFLNHAIEEAPDRACIAYYYRGHIQLKSLHTADAVRDYSLATQKTCAAFGEARIALGLAYQQSKQYDLARKTFLEIEKRFPNTQLAKQAMNQLKYLP